MSPLPQPPNHQRGRHGKGGWTSSWGSWPAVPPHLPVLLVYRTCGQARGAAWGWASSCGSLPATSPRRLSCLSVDPVDEQEEHQGSKPLYKEPYLLLPPPPRLSCLYMASSNKQGEWRGMVSLCENPLLFFPSEGGNSGTLFMRPAPVVLQSPECRRGEQRAERGK